MSSLTETNPNSSRSISGLALSFAKNIGRSAQHHRVMLTVALLIWALSKVLNLYFGRTTGGGTGFYLSIIFKDILPVLGSAALIISVGKHLITSKSDTVLPDLLQSYREMLFDMSRLSNILIVFTALSLGVGGFSELKPLIPFLQPYSWDVAFMEIDRFVHFGHDPWVLLSPIFGSSTGTRTLNFIYNFWFYIIFVFWILAAWAKPNLDASGASPIKADWGRQFTLAFMLTWIIGGFFLAILWSSMGPAFYDLVDPANNPFAAQMAALGALDAESSLWAIQTQGLLRESYLNPGSGGPEGISAMPSIHNATTALFVFAGYRINRLTGHLMTVFAACILIGSVHLGWHYAIDGYVGILIAWACWWGAGRILRRG